MTAQSVTPPSVPVLLLRCCEGAAKRIRTGTKALDWHEQESWSLGASTAPGVYQASIGATWPMQGLRGGAAEAFQGHDWAAQWAATMAMTPGCVDLHLLFCGHRSEQSRGLAGLTLGQGKPHPPSPLSPAEAAATS